MGAQEASPGNSCSSRCGRDAVAAEQLADAGGGDAMAELEQFAANAHVAPKWVLPPRQPQHQLLASTRPAAMAARDYGGGRKRTSADGPERGGSPGSWPDAPGAGRSTEAGERGQPGSGDRPSASEAVELC